MDKGKNSFVENEYIKEINKTAEKAYILKCSNNIRYKTEYNKLASLVLDRVNSSKPANIESGDYQGCADITFIYCLKKWKPDQAGFWAFFKSTLAERIPDIQKQNLDTYYRGAYRKMKKESDGLTKEQRAALRPEVTRENFYTNSDEENTVKNFPDSLNMETDLNQSEGVKNIFDLLNKIILTQKKKYENSPKICYETYFYTEFVTRRIEEENDRSVFDKAEKELMRVIDHDFVSYYMIGDNSSVAGIAQGKLKKVSAFTKDPSDDRPCGYDIENIVYAKYISALKKRDKIQSDSSISQQRTKFTQLIQLEMKNSLNNE